MSEHTPEQRERFIAAMRELCDMLESHPNLPLPYGDITVYVGAEYDGNGYDDEHIKTPAETVARHARRGVSGWVKDPGSERDSYVTYTKTLTPDDTWPPVSYRIAASKAGTCVRVQTGVKHVEAREAHDEPIYTWQCES